MSNSDSDAFESADDEFQEQKTKKEDKHVEVSDSKLKEVPEEMVIYGHEKIHVKNLKESPNPETTPQDQKSWKSWGAFSLISNASKSVASITTQVSLHISSAIDNLNIPEPEQMAKVVIEEEKQSKEDLLEIRDVDNSSEKSTDDNKFNMSNLLSGVSEMSSKMVSGGLDTLEGIGRKTINILQESDPNLKNKILGMSGQIEKPNLSEILKEAKERPEDFSDMPQKSVFFTKLISFEQSLDDYKGLVYLEAIEILSNQSKMRIESLIKPLNGKALTEMEETLEEVKELCELPESDNFDEEITAEILENKLINAIMDLNLTLNFKEIVSFTKECLQWLNDLEHGTINEIYEKSINVLANSCALSIGNLQKLAELLLSMDHRSTADEADSLTQLIAIYLLLLNHLASKFSEKLTLFISGDESKKQTTNIFLEVMIFFFINIPNRIIIKSFQCSTATNYIRRAFNLFIPVLQIGAI
ncbi:unnamed protein product [Diamesa hyperborea]